MPSTWADTRSKSSRSSELWIGAARVAPVPSRAYGRASIRKFGTDMTDDDKRIAALIATEIGARAEQAAAAIQLLDEGASVLFIARYRKEVTGGLDDTQLRALTERLAYLREFHARRAAILDSIRSQDKLTPELEAQIGAAITKAELEDLYLPYKPKRRTKAEIARERGLGPLAEAILADRSLVPAEAALAYLTEEVKDVKAALEGARDIVCEAM